MPKGLLTDNEVLKLTTRVTIGVNPGIQNEAVVTIRVARKLVDGLKTERT